MGLYSGLASMLIFIIIFVATAQIAQDWILGYVNLAQDNNWFSVALIIGGFFLVAIIQIVSIILTNDGKENFNTSMIAILIAFFINFILWALTAHITLKLTSPDIVAGLSFGEKIILTPRIIVIFSVITLHHPFFFWGMSLITQTCMFIIFVKILSDYQFKDTNSYISDYGEMF